MNFQRFVNGGAVPLVVFIFAGEGEHNSKTRGSEDYIWAHYKAEFTRINGVAFNSYFVGNELTPIYKRENGQVVMEDGYPVVDHREPDGIGVLCHELGHALGLPDFYSTSGNPLDFQTPDLFDVMDYGQYWNDGYAPMGYSAYERACLGWLQPDELKVPTDISALVRWQACCRHAERLYIAQSITSNRSGVWKSNGFPLVE